MSTRITGRLLDAEVGTKNLNPQNTKPLNTCTLKGLNLYRTLCTSRSLIKPPIKSLDLVTRAEKKVPKVPKDRLEAPAT